MVVCHRFVNITASTSLFNYLQGGFCIYQVVAVLSVYFAQSAPCVIHAGNIKILFAPPVALPTGLLSVSKPFNMAENYIATVPALALLGIGGEDC